MVQVLFMRINDMAKFLKNKWWPNMIVHYNNYYRIIAKNNVDFQI